MMLRDLFRKYARKKTESSGYLELTEENLNIHVPSNPGLFMLAMRLGKDLYYTFHTNQTENLYRELRKIMEEHDEGHPAGSQRGNKRAPCFFVFFPFSKLEQRCDIEKIFASSIYSDQSISIVSNN